MGLDLEILRAVTLPSIFLRVFLALLVGGMLGLERGRKNRPAGFRTYMLVCLGSTLVMLTNQYVFQEYQISDPVRMGAQVVSGVGFLGVGTIITTGHSQVKGITTAAGMWTAACCGLAIGIGFYEGAIVGSIAILVVMSVMQKIDTVIRQHARILDLYLEFESKCPFSQFLVYARENNLDITVGQMNKNKYVKGASLSVVLSVKSRIKLPHNKVMEVVGSAPGISYMEEL